MRRKAKAKKASSRGAQGNANFRAKSQENTPLKLRKLIGRPTKTPAGKGLGKAGAKRLGRLLKRAIIQDQESAGEGKVSLPKTPVRLLKYQIQSEAENAPKTNTKATSHVSQLILSVVTRCKHRGGISMAELKQTLAAGGYDVTKNNRRVTVTTKRLVNDETLVRTTRNASFRLHNKKLAETLHLKTSAIKSPKPKEDLKQSKSTTKPPKGTGKPQRQARMISRAQKPKGKTHKPAAKSQKPKGKTHTPAAKSQKPKGKTRKPAAKSQKPTGKTHKPATKSYRPRHKKSKARRKSSKPAGRKRRSVKNRAAQVRKSPRKSQKARRRGPKQNLYRYKFSQRRQHAQPRLPKMRLRLKTWQRRVSRRKAYY